MVRIVYRLSDITLNCVVSGLVTFVFVKVLVWIYEMAGSYNGDYSWIVTYAYWMEMVFIYVSAWVAVLRILIEERWI